MACTATISPHSMRRLCTSWIMFSRIGTGAELAAPGAVVEVDVGLEEGGAAHHRHQPPELTGLDHLARLGHDRAVRPVVADEHACATALDLLHQALGLGHGGRDRLFQQDGYARFDALQGLRHVQGIRRGQHHAIGAVPRQQFIE